MIRGMDSEIIRVRTGARVGVMDFTTVCAEYARNAAGGSEGVLHVFVPHATAGIAPLELGARSDEDLLSTPIALVDLNVDNQDRQVRLSFLS